MLFGGGLDWGSGITTEPLDTVSRCMPKSHLQLSTTKKGILCFGSMRTQGVSKYQYAYPLAGRCPLANRHYSISIDNKRTLCVAKWILLTPLLIMLLLCIYCIPFLLVWLVRLAQAGFHSDWLSISEA